MILYIDRSEVPNLEEVSSDVLRWCIQKGEQAAGRYYKLDRYYRGDHDILHATAEPGAVRVTANYAKYVVDIILGYYLGTPVKYDAAPRKDGAAVGDSDGPETGPGLSRPEEIDLSPILDAYDAQQMARIDADIARTMGIAGDCLELCYASADLDPRPRSARIKPASGILVCDSTVEHNKLFGLVWDLRERVNGEKYYFVTVYTDRTSQDYQSTSLANTVFSPVGERRPHFFGAVPVIAYENNSERQGDFEQIIPLIDAYDQLMSDRVTDKRKFVDALLVFFGMTLREEDRDNLVKEKFIDAAPLDARAEYIQKTFDEGGVQVLADALVREMHKQTLTVDMSDEKFSGNASGQALKLKLLTMNMLVNTKIPGMRKGLQERLSLYNHWLGVKGEMPPLSVADVDIRFTLSTPINESEIVQTVTQLQGMVDSQTLLSQLWFVTDPKEAAELAQAERMENQRRYVATFGTGSPQEEDEADQKAGAAIDREPGKDKR